MASDWLNHRALAIIRGVYTVPGDTASVEPAIVTLNLMTSGQSGISLQSDGWSPNIPPLKNSGVWADSPIADGRTLLSGVNGNVLETMQLTITGSTQQEAIGYLSQLRNMMQDARDFWQSNQQINPVYLAWWASCGAGKQYALIYNMDFKPEYMASPTPTIQVTLTLERECFWRSIPPGANPKQWTYEFNNQASSYDYSKADLVGSDSLLVKTALSNRSEFATGLATLITDNCIVVPANLIPGDAPALMSLVSDNGTPGYNFIMGLKTQTITQRNAAGSGLVAQNGTFNLPDFNPSTDASFVNDTGGVKPAGGANAQRLEVSFATVATDTLRWSQSATIITDTANRFIGRYMVFLRCRQINGAAGAISMYLRVGTSPAITDTIKLNVTSPQLVGAVGNTTTWGLTYMGVFESPLTPYIVMCHPYRHCTVYARFY